MGICCCLLDPKTSSHQAEVLLIEHLSAIVGMYVLPPVRRPHAREVAYREVTPHTNNNQLSSRTTSATACPSACTSAANCCAAASLGSLPTRTR